MIYCRSLLLRRAARELLWWSWSSVPLILWNYPTLSTSAERWRHTAEKRDGLDSVVVSRFFFQTELLNGHTDFRAWMGLLHKALKLIWDYSVIIPAIEMLDVLEPFLLPTATWISGHSLVILTAWHQTRHKIRPSLTAIQKPYIL